MPTIRPTTEEAMSDLETVRYAETDGIARITMTRPDKRNAMNAVMFAELAHALELAAIDERARAVIVTGLGPSFSAGIDLALLGELAGLIASSADEPGGFETFVRSAQRPFALLAQMPKPTIAAVRGHALGAGFQLALACDLRITASDARLGMLEARYGLIPDLGGMHRLARLVGPSRAKELVWSARLIEADEARRLGLANLVVEPDELDAEADDLARRMTMHSPTALRLTKDLIDRSFETPLEEEFEREARAQGEALSGSDHRESIAAFLERRPPRFDSG